jgi:hypothetical protein
MPRAGDNSDEYPEPVTTLTALKRKLHPCRFSGMSKRMASILGCMLGEFYSNPSFTSLSVTSTGYVIGSPEGSYDYDVLLGAYSDVENNWNRLLEAAELTPEERTLANRLFIQALPPPDSTTVVTATKSYTINEPDSKLTDRDEQLLRKLRVRW